MTADMTPMNLSDAVGVLAELRGDDQAVVTTMGPSREWLKLPPHPLDFHHVPATMSGTVPLALGIALAQSDREVLVATGDGSLLMNLGCLVSVVAARAANLTVVVFDNGVYEITGGQKTPAADADVDYAGLARAAGFRSVWQFAEINEWRRQASDVFQAEGPRFVHLVVKPVTEDYILYLPCPIGEQIDRLRQALTRPTAR